jgi:hypothetical protein
MAEDGDGNAQKVKEKKKEDYSGKTPRSCVQIQIVVEKPGVPISFNSRVAPLANPHIHWVLSNLISVVGVSYTGPTSCC